MSYSWNVKMYNVIRYTFKSCGKIFVAFLHDHGGVKEGTVNKTVGTTSDGYVNNEEFGTLTTIEFFWPEAESRVRSEMVCRALHTQ